LPEEASECCRPAFGLAHPDAITDLSTRREWEDHHLTQAKEQGMNTSSGLGQNDRWAVVLAGGEGNRLRSYIHRIAGRECPKQFFPVLGTATLLEQTLARVSLRIAPERTLTVVNHAHEKFYSAISKVRPDLNLLVQHDNLGTAPAILYSLLAIAKRSPDASVAIFPSDHYVSDEERFMDYVDSALDSITRRPETPVVLGIVPDNAGDGYGWIERGHLISSREELPLYRISRFWEKPALHIASVMSLNKV
jgi:mannose-1-phosphate guanylyltransferase